MVPAAAKERGTVNIETGGCQQLLCSSSQKHARGIHTTPNVNKGPAVRNGR